MPGKTGEKYYDYARIMKYFIQKKKRKKYFIPHNVLYIVFFFFSGKSHIFPHKFYFIFEHVFNTNVIVFL